MYKVLIGESEYLGLVFHSLAHAKSTRHRVKLESGFWPDLLSNPSPALWLLRDNDDKGHRHNPKQWGDMTGRLCSTKAMQGDSRTDMTDLISFRLC